MTRRSEQWQMEALQKCWDEQMTPLQFARYAGVTRAQVYAIMAGREWKRVPRPIGFVYPFPNAKQREDEAWKAECLVDYVNDRMSLEDFALHVGCSLPTALKVLRGESWIAVSRPPGFAYPWPRKSSRT